MLATILELLLELWSHCWLLTTLDLDWTTWTTTLDHYVGAAVGAGDNVGPTVGAGDQWSHCAGDDPGAAVGATLEPL